MKSIGSYLALFGIATLILPFLGMEIRFLGWLDEMGTKGLIIKIAAVIIGAVLYFKGGSEKEEEGQMTEDQ